MFFLDLFFELNMEQHVDRLCLKDHGGGFSFFLFEGVNSGINLIWTY